MTAAPVSTFASLSWAERLWLDLQPTPGRLAAALRIVLTTVIALVLMMVLQLPFAALGLYYIFLIVRESPAVSLKTGFISFLTLPAAVAAVLAVVIVFDNDPTARLLSVAIVSFISGTLMIASTAAPLASIWGFIYCTVIAFWERPAPPDALVKTSLYLLATVSLALLCSVVVEYLFAFRRSDDRLAEQFKIRYQTLEGAFTLLAQDAPPARLREAIAPLNRLAGAGVAGMLQLYNAVVDSDLRAGRRTKFSQTQITMLVELLDAAAAFASQHPTGADLESRSRCAEIARLCHEQKPDPASANYVLPAAPTLLDRVEAALNALLSNAEEWSRPEGRELAALPPTEVPFLIPGAVHSKDTIVFALKFTLCVMVCYIFYFAVAWPGISTVVTTVFITALGNSGATKQKLANRVLGSAIGGAMAIGATVFLFPYMDSITSLVLLIATVAFIAAWWAGGRQFGYAGLQIAFSFYLVAFEGFSAPTELEPARDRLVGIVVALAVMWLVFDQLWPVRTVAVMRRALAAIFRGEARLLRIFESDESHARRLRQMDLVRDQIAKTIASLRTMNDTLAYEFGVDRQAQIRSGDIILQTALTAVPFFWNQLSVFRREEDRHFVAHPRLIEMRSTVAHHLDQMAQSVVDKTNFPLLIETDLADTSILDDPQYGEYTRNTVLKHQELQTLVTALTASV